MSFPKKVYIVSEVGWEWDVVLDVFKHRPDAVKFQQEVIAKNESVVLSNLDNCDIKLSEYIVK